MTKFGSVATLVGSSLGALIFIVGFLGANGAPQEAAASAAGVALAVIPYCFARALKELSNRG
jgi:hypothetical protein